MNQTEIDRSLRGIAGVVITLSIVLYFTHSHNWIFMIAFVGINLLQSYFTRWCPMITLLKKLFPDK